METVEKLKHSFFKRYALALSLIAVMSLCSFAAMYQLIEKQAESAEIINLSGRQRMLSQRISLYAELYSNSTNPEAQSEYLQILKDEIQTFKTKHEILVARKPNNGKTIELSEDLQELYFSEPDATDQAALEFIAAAESVAQNPASKDATLKIHEILKRNLLAKLDRVVATHQKEAELDVSNAKRAELVIFLATAILLLCEALFIFKPMQNAILNLFRKLTTAQNDVAQAATDKSNFLATITDEVRTPMIAVQGIMDFLLKSDLNQGQKGQLETAQRMSEKLILLVDDILEFSKLDSGKVVVENQTFNLETLLTNVEKLFRPTAEKKGIHFTIHLDESIRSELRGDPSRINQVLSNLIANAIKFTSPAGSIRVTVRSVPGPTNELIFEVKDSGIGIHPSEKAKLFQPKAQNKDSKPSQPGDKGLGLSVSKQMIEIMNGEIGVDSEVGVGSCFWFRLRLPSAPQITQLMLSPEAELKTDWSKIRVLMAEDNVIMQKIVALMLQTLDCEVTVCNDGAEALASFQKEKFDLIFLDCEMPNMDGFEAAKAIRLHELTHEAAKTPIIAMSAHIAPEIRAKCLDAGMDEYTEKPIKKQALVTILNQWLPRESESIDRLKAG